jgi:para-nitrobenzyl esterase
MRSRRSLVLQMAGVAVVSLTTSVLGAMARQFPTSHATALEGTSWQLVRFQDGDDDKTLALGDRAKYTIAFANGGQVTMRLDCNRGTGTWKSPEPGQLQFGPLATTRALCPPGSLYDRLVQDMEHVRSYVLKGGRLYLSLMADGGIYEFEREPAGAP